MFRYGAKARLIAKLRNNSDDLYKRLHEVFQDDVYSQNRINRAINDIDDLIQYIEDCSDSELEQKVIQALKKY